MNIQHIRNATMVVHYAGQKILIDPFFAEQGSMPAFPNTPNQDLMNPLVPLPTSVHDLIDVDVVIVTHLHPDHFDEAAKQSLPKDIHILAQNRADVKAIQQEGFTNVHSLENTCHIGNVKVTKTGGQHGRGDLTKITGTVSGVVFQHPDEHPLYIAGDTVWCEDVKEAIRTYSPEVIVVNSGAAQFLEGGPITMTKEDIYNTYQAASHANMVVVHMETLNHCLLTRNDLQDFLNEKDLNDQIVVPNDGETLTY